MSLLLGPIVGFLPDSNNRISFGKFVFGGIAVIFGGLLFLVLAMWVWLTFFDPFEGFPNGRGPGTAHYRDTHLCTEVPEVVGRQILDAECSAMQSSTLSPPSSSIGNQECALTLGIAAATMLEDGQWMVYGDLIGGPGLGSPAKGITGIYSFPLIGEPNYWLVAGAFDGTGSVVALDNGEFIDLVRDRQTLIEDTDHTRLYAGPPPATVCLNHVPQPTGE